ncbi:ABC-type transport system, involved in lipoprotein release, permease component [Candidatus Methanoperedens nitroreducens]|uniref:ABC-type transport system, involved in lipoprotein release, permease component n=1 Tax=Candidatus Methanoperedens nitratireducens TaxID=1392998 RepID=A0A062VBY6_9EURY|nr:FtsX-like permease family protein [Candidatus Methanoperedens nitroreducens]KCZ72810.1 ABC-type transport system, involved in lipoprotein release, permease component [Candidatus Methanoperedens nitroreducens]MDJ1423260.1 FtsX-like permease family protein [Candidatus Methanoperedens sp.]
MLAKIAFLNLRRRRSRTSRTFFTALAIGIPVAAAILLTSVSIGIYQESSAAFEEQADFWVIPSGSGALDPVTNSERTMLGDIHRRIDILRSYPDVKSATPVLSKALYAARTEPRVILGIGIIPDDISLIPDGALSSGDPYYYGNNFTREVAINQQLSKLLGVKERDNIYLGVSASDLLNSTPFQVTAIVDSAEFSASPVAIMHISELQELTGNLNADRANQVIVKGSNLMPLLQAYFPDAVVLSEAEYYANSIADDKRILATAVTVTAVSLILGILFISSAVVFSINEQRKEFAVMRAIGISDRSIMKIVIYEAIMISIAGGILGSGAGLAGMHALNALSRSFFEGSVISVINPLVIIAALSTAIIAGAVSGILPALLIRRANIVRELV